MARITIDLPGITQTRMQQVFERISFALKGNIRETDHPMFIVDYEDAGTVPPPENTPEKPGDVCECPRDFMREHPKVVANVKGDNHLSECPMYEFDPDSIPF